MWGVEKDAGEEITLRLNGWCGTASESYCGFGHSLAYCTVASITVLSLNSYLRGVPSSRACVRFCAGLRGLKAPSL